MRNPFASALCLVLASVALGPAPPVRAASTDAEPVMPTGTKPFDLLMIPWVNDESRKLLGDYFAKLATGEAKAVVVAAAPSGNWGLRRTDQKSPQRESMKDMERAALEQCEYLYFQPCRLIAVNKIAAADDAGGYPEQPGMLSGEPSDLDYLRVPFVPSLDRTSLRSHQLAASPKASAMANSRCRSYAMPPAATRSPKLSARRSTSARQGTPVRTARSMP